MKNAYKKDIIRTIRSEKKRFFSIMAITILGVTMATCLKASCVDLRYSADTFFDEQQLFDIKILSTLGLTDSDVEALSGLDGVECVEGAHNETLYTMINDKRHSVDLNTMSEKMNGLLVLEGELPQNTHEIAVTNNYLSDSGKKIGGTIIFEQSDSDYFTETEYKITAVVTDVKDINNSEGAVSFRVSSTTDYTFYTFPKEHFADEIYTAVYLKMSDTDELFCYSDSYEERVSQLKSYIEDMIKEDRKRARDEQIKTDAYEEFDKAKAEVDEELDEAQQKLSDARNELEDGKEQLRQGEEELQEQQQSTSKLFEQYYSEIEEGKTAIENASAQLDAAENELDEGRSQLEASKQQLTQQQAQISEQIEGLQVMRAQLAQLGQDTAQTDEQLSQAAYAKAQLDEASAQLAAKEAELEAGYRSVSEARLELEQRQSDLYQSESELRQQEISAWQQISEAQAEIDENRDTLESAEQELNDSSEEFEEKKREAYEELEKERQKIEDLDLTEWYLQDRNSLSGYANIESDASSIESIGNVFPVLFLTIAVLISLTTITRMVEEDRGLIGTYKALGFTDAEILKKYLVYTMSACICGGILGNAGGFVVLPQVMFVIFKTMYVLPDYEMHYDPVYGISSIMLFVVVIAAAVLYACYKEQKEVPAVLMRPKAPRTGSRVLLEKIPFIWNRFSFLNKVTARNLFRYKKRLFMTVIGIMGCTGLLICGFSVRDTVTELRPRQYDKVSQYDFMAVTADDNDKLLSYVDDNENIADFINIQYESVKVICGKNEQTLQMIVIPEGQSIEKYVSLKDKKGNDIFLDNEGIIVTYNAASVLGFDKGDTVTVQKTNLTQEELPVSGIVENYLGNMIYMTQPVYEKYFGEFAPNGIYANFTEKCSDEVEFTKDFARQDGVLTAVSKQELQNDFSNAFMILNLVVYIVIVLAAALALVVLFTLSTTNISERERELATIKVLGFYDREVHLYVNKETLILTIIGILCGMPMGWFFGMWIGYSLNMPSINYEVVIHPASYIISGLIAFCFALAVNVITNRILNRINPVEALKSVE